MSALAELKAEGAAALLSRCQAPAGAKWYEHARDNAEARLNIMGAPIARDEYWRYTNPANFVQDWVGDEFHALSDEFVPAGDHLSMVFIGGVFDASRSDKLNSTAAVIETLDAVRDVDIHWAKDLYGVLETFGQEHVARPMAALNTARATDGLVLHVTGKMDHPIVLRHIDGSSDVLLHHVIKVEAGAEATIIEIAPRAGRSNDLIEIDIAPGGTLHHLRIQAPDADPVRNANCFARLGEESVFKSLTISANGVFTRNETVITFTGDNAQATVAGAAAGDGEAFHHDDTVFVTHDAVNCESRQVFKKVLRNGATGVFQGKILVKADAQKTDGYQISQGLLLDDDSQFLAKPELEIYADDVACSHGSTVGAIDETAVFYLTSRGVPRRQAVDMLVQAFLGEAIDELEDDDLAEEMKTHLAKWMSAQVD